MIFKKLYLIPLVLAVLFSASIITTYVISVALDHVRPFFPYISDTGTTPPESTIFGQALNIAAVLTYITFYIRFKQVKTLYSDPNLPHYSKVALLNRISLWITFPVALGISMVANFQETNTIVPHLIGAFLCFIFALLYFWIHTIISYITCPSMNTLTIARLRLLIILGGSVTNGGAGLFGLISYVEFSKKKSIADLPKWGPDDGGFELHLISTFSEHITLILYGCYMLTFIKDFRDIVLHSPKVEKLSCVNSQTTENNININCLDNMDKVSDDDNKETVSKAADIAKGGGKILLV